MAHVTTKLSHDYAWAFRDPRENTALYITSEHFSDNQSCASIYKNPWELAWPLFPNLDYTSGFWKRHLSSNPLRRVSISLQCDKITQKTFKGQEQHTEGKRAKERSTRVGKMSTTRKSPVSIPVRESRRREHSLWQQFELSSHSQAPWRADRSSHHSAREPSAEYARMVGFQWLPHATGTSMRCTRMAPRRDAPVGDVEDSVYPRIAGSEVTAVRTFPATVLCGGREERRRRRGRGQVASHITPERRRDAEGATVRPALVT